MQGTRRGSSDFQRAVVGRRFDSDQFKQRGKGARKEKKRPNVKAKRGRARRKGGLIVHGARRVRVNYLGGLRCMPSDMLMIHTHRNS